MQVALKGHLHAHVHLQVALKGHLQMLRVQFAFGKLHTLLHMHFAFGKMHVPQMHATFGGMHLLTSNKVSLFDVSMQVAL